MLVSPPLAKCEYGRESMAGLHLQVQRWFLATAGFPRPAPVGGMAARRHLPPTLLLLLAARAGGVDSRGRQLEITHGGLTVPNMLARPPSLYHRWSCIIMLVHTNRP